MEPAILNGFIGGCLIGAGSLVALIVTGKTPGISGVIGRLFRPAHNQTGWRWIFLAGLIAGAAILFRSVDSAAVFLMPDNRTWLILIAAGFLVGFGTRLGGGCTSGHGICGIGMGARDSLIATCLFMAAGIFTVFLFRQFIDGS